MIPNHVQPVLAHKVPAYHWTIDLGFDGVERIIFSSYFDVNLLVSVALDPGPIDGSEGAPRDRLVTWVRGDGCHHAPAVDEKVFAHARVENVWPQIHTKVVVLPVNGLISR